jgi:hypothetical protein
LSENQAALAGALGESLDATVIQVAGAVEDDLLDVLLLGSPTLRATALLSSPAAATSAERAETTVRPPKSSTTWA